MSTATPWAIVKAHLEATGRIVDGKTKTVKAGTCKTCHAPVLSAIDSSGRPADVNPDPISALGEALALLAGRDTWALVKLAGKAFELWPRDQFSIRGKPAGSEAAKRFDVVAEHRCGAAPLPALPSVHAAAAEAAVLPEECPF